MSKKHVPFTLIVQTVYFILLFLLTPTATLPVSESSSAYGIEDINSIINAWSVTEGDNVLVRYKVFEVDENGHKKKNTQAEVMHVLFEGDVSVRVNYEKSNKSDRITRWIYDSSVTWSEVQVGNNRGYFIEHIMEPGADAVYGFMFSGFASLDIKANLTSYGYPNLDDQILFEAQEEDEISVTYTNVGQTIRPTNHVVVFGATDNRLRRLETWAMVKGESEMVRILNTEFSEWISVNGRFRPKTLIFRSFSNLSGIVLEFIEMLPSTKEDIVTLPQPQYGDGFNDKRVEFVGTIGENIFTVDGYAFTSKVPVSGPPLNFDELMQSVEYLSDVNTENSDSSKGSLVIYITPALVFISVSLFVWLILKRLRN